MIVDCHTHFIDYDTEMSAILHSDIQRCHIGSQWRFTKEDYLEATKEADAAIVFGIRAAKTGWFSCNERLAALVKDFGDKYIFFASIDPTENDFVEQLAYTHKTLGAAGIKLGPVYQGVHPHDPRYRTIYEYCEKHGLPIITHMAATFSQGVPLSYANPLLMDEIACLYPKLKIVLAHMGHPWIAETISIIPKQPNVYADISALFYRPMQFYQAMLTVEEYRASEKLLFGSDYPATTTAQSIAGMLAVNDVLGEVKLPKVSLVMMREIMYRDTLNILGIK